MKIVFNSSPLIFLSRLDYLDLFLRYDYQFYTPEVVIDEINAKQDEASQYVNHLVGRNSLTIQQTRLLSLANSINERLGRGEAEAVALATELQSDYVILDDFAAPIRSYEIGFKCKRNFSYHQKNDGR